MKFGRCCLKIFTISDFLFRKKPRFLSGSKNPQPLLESTLKEGWDVVLVDSLEAITGRVAMTSSLNQKESLQ